MIAWYSQMEGEGEDRRGKRESLVMVWHCLEGVEVEVEEEERE